MTKKGSQLSRKDALEAIAKRFEKTGKIDPMVYALLNRNERMTIVLKTGVESSAQRKKRLLAEAGEDKCAHVKACFESGKSTTLGEIAETCGVSTEVVSYLYCARFRKISYWTKR